MPSIRLGATLAAALLALPPPARADDARPWYAPDHAKLQLAGNVGFMSPGVGYTWGQRLDGDLFLGWVPKAIGGTDIYSVTGKLTFAPWSPGAGQWELHPFTAAVQLTYTFGKQYMLYDEHEFPILPTALRAGLGIGAAASRRQGRRRVSIYAELVALDHGLGYWLANRSALGPEDVFSFAAGARVEM